MVFKFSIISDEVASFRREIKIDADATFLDLHTIIMDCNGYDKTEMTSFFMSDERWNKKQEISLVELETDSDVDSFIMEEEVLSDWLEEEGQRLIFVFDYYNMRGYFMELSEIILGKNLFNPICNYKRGLAPAQFIKEEETPKPKAASVSILESEEDFYGDEDYDPEELDKEGFDELEGPDDLDIELDVDLDTDLL
ncbi:MAG: hypothetical protein PHN55_03730 [Dysgonamonadaceae bacterium]|nr:hypothetical protein [Dysgonamonadaceae bacterium]